MKIAHIVTYVSSDGAWGGPIAVARNLAREQARVGHDVTIFAAWDGRAEFVENEVAVRLHRRLFKGSLRSVFSARLLGDLWASVRGFDIVHVHMGRDLVTAPAALIASMRGVAVVTQPHGMIAPDTRLIARMFDRLLTRRALARARALLCLTEKEQADLAQVIGAAMLTVRINNGIASADAADSVLPRDTRNVLYLSRLAERKRPRAFVHVASSIIDEYPDVTFSMVGPDEGELAAVLRDRLQLRSPERLTYEGTVGPGEAIHRIAQSGVLVLPSVGEVFPMVVLEAMAARTPVVLTSDCGLAPLLANAEAAVVTEPSVDGLRAGVLRVINDRAYANRLCRNASRLLETDLSIAAVADRVEQVYRHACRASDGSQQLPRSGNAQQDARFTRTEGTSR